MSQKTSTASRKAAKVKWDFDNVQTFESSPKTPRLVHTGTQNTLVSEFSEAFDGAEELDGTYLIDNGVSQVFNAVDSVRLDVLSCLEDLGIQFDKEAAGTDKDKEALKGIATMRATFQTRASVFMKSTTMSSSNGCDGPDRLEAEHLQRLFHSGGTTYVVREEHTSLARLIGNIFSETRFADDTPSLSSGVSSVPRLFTFRSMRSFAVTNRLRAMADPVGNLMMSLMCSVPWWMLSMRIRCRRLLDNGFFSSFFLALTLYSLFCADLLVIYGTRDTEEAVLIVNAVIFLLFLIEFVLQAIGVKGYTFSVPCLLDFVVLVSILGDTWFLKHGGLVDDEEANRLSRMARTSKMTRLARIARVARITKLIPLLMKFLRKQNLVLAKKVLMRRLWRVFLLLDGDGDGLLNQFDVKVFYLTCVQECPYILYRRKSDLLTEDVPTMLRAMTRQDDMHPYINFDLFVSLLLRTELGAGLVRFQLEDVEQEYGVWTITQKLSDTTALKVCVGILVLVTLVSFLEIVPQDLSIAVSVSQLAHVAETVRGGPLEAYHMCEQIALFVDRLFAHSRHEVLFVYLQGSVYYDRARGGCLAQWDAAVDPAARAREIRQNRTTRDIDFAWVCLPDCLGNMTSASLVDQSWLEKNNSMWAVITIVIVIILMLIFVYVLNMKMNVLSGNLLQPLHSLVDDMTAMSCLELVHIDKDMPGDTKPVRIVEELQDLQNAFRAMRLAIRSWSKYVPPCVVERLFSTGTEACVGVARCYATILFVDINGFEECVRDLDPGTVLVLLSNVFGSVSDCITRNKGVLLEFIGDEVLAVFNTPSPMKNHPLAGVKTAQEIHAVVQDRVMVTSAIGEQVYVSCRCGVHTGDVLAGNIGSHKRMKYGLLGDGINLAARLKGLNSRYGTPTLCSGNVLTADGGRAVVGAIMRPVDVVAVKGKTEPTTVYEVMQVGLQQVWKREASKLHAEAFNHYQGQRFQQAREKFDEVQALFVEKGLGQDEPSRMLSARCVAYLDNPPPAGWDGVDRLSKKSFAAPPKGGGHFDAPGRDGANGYAAALGQTSAASSSSQAAARAGAGAGDVDGGAASVDEPAAQ